MTYGKLLFRRPPHLVCYWAAGRLVFHNYATGARVAADPITCTVLDCFDRWRPAEALFSRLRGHSPASLRNAIRELVRCSLLERSDQSSRRRGALNSWDGWNPAAGFFHFSTKDQPFIIDPVEVRAFIRQRAENARMPGPVKRYPGVRAVRLPQPKVEGEFPRVLLARRTWRRFAPAPIELPTLATLLKLTYGVQDWIDFYGLGRLARKTSPSAGARHPIEAYVISLRVRGLARGIYHYAPDRHCLELLKRGSSRRQAAGFLAGQTWFGGTAVLVLMTACFPRAQWKYPHPRAYRAVLLDAGHLCQTFCLVATWLGLAPFCTMALADTTVEKALGVDGVTESVMYAAGAGVRPPASA